jgi:transketolase
VLEANGHDVADLRRTLAQAMSLPASQPGVVICHTVKGKGIPAAENNASWHHKAELSDDVRHAIGLPPKGSKG